MLSRFAEGSGCFLHGTELDWSFLLLQPERIDPSASRQGYDVRSDVWSLGITLVSEGLCSPAALGTVGVSQLGSTAQLCRVLWVKWALAGSGAAWVLSM